ncbi:MAG TPA: hypothetical protein ENI97_08485 [Gammaproteobacteria bacterium]|nr:hypothetical protein [Gammaproteobacteria bacterium]
MTAKDISRYLLLGFALLPFDVFSDSSMVLDRNELVAGLTQGDYVNMWWQWAVSMPASESPVRDRMGDKCGVNQVGPVWFLAGGYGSSHIKRSCTLPSDKYIFFPVINMVYYPRDGKVYLAASQ